MVRGFATPWALFRSSEAHQRAEGRAATWPAPAPDARRARLLRGRQHHVNPARQERQQPGQAESPRRHRQPRGTRGRQARAPATQLAAATPVAIPMASRAPTTAEPLLCSQRTPVRPPLCSPGPGTRTGTPSSRSGRARTPRGGWRSAPRTARTTSDQRATVGARAPICARDRLLQHRDCVLGKVLIACATTATRSSAQGSGASTLRRSRRVFCASRTTAAAAAGPCGQARRASSAPPTPHFTPSRVHRLSQR